MAKPTVRRQTKYVALTKEQFRERFFARFYDAAFDDVTVELEKVFENAWDGYIVYRKSPRKRAAGAAPSQSSPMATPPDRRTSGACSPIGSPSWR